MLPSLHEAPDAVLTGDRLQDGHRLVATPAPTFGAFTVDDERPRGGATVDVAARGRLGIYLGMAPGVGKTSRLLEEGHRRLSRGIDVVIGFIEPHGRGGVAARATGLEAVPARRVEHAGAVVEEMDLEAILERRPRLALIDELAHANAPGSVRRHRWEDIEIVLDAGIDVLSTLNVGHVHSIAGAVSTVLGGSVGERVPDAVIAGADDIEFVDVSPRELRERIADGQVFEPERARAALEAQYTEPKLATLRAIAWRFAARDLEGRLEATTASPLPVFTERVMVLLDGSAASWRAMRGAAALAAALRGAFIAVVIETPDSGRRPPYVTRDAMEALAAATELGAQPIRVAANEVAPALVELARSRRATHLVLPHRTPGRFRGHLDKSLADRILDRVPALEVHLVGATAGRA
jgi:two-component system sensor histidine kinase KdpD